MGWEDPVYASFDKGQLHMMSHLPSRDTQDCLWEAEVWAFLCHFQCKILWKSHTKSIWWTLHVFISEMLNFWLQYSSKPIY